MGGGFDKKVMPEDLERVQEMARKLHQNKSVAHAFALHMEQARNQPVNPEVESLLAQYPSIQAHVAARLRALPRDAQAAVLIKGGLMNAREPSAVLLRRIQAVDPHNTTWVPMPRTPAGQRFPTHQELAAHHGVIASMVPANSLAPIALGPRVETPYVMPPQQLQDIPPEEPKPKVKDPEDERDEEMDYALTMIAEKELLTGSKAGTKEIANFAESSRKTNLSGNKPVLSDWRRSRPQQGQEVAGQAGMPPDLMPEPVLPGPVLPVGPVFSDWRRSGPPSGPPQAGAGLPQLQDADEEEEVAEVPEASGGIPCAAAKSEMPQPKAPGLYIQGQRFDRNVPQFAKQPPGGPPFPAPEAAASSGKKGKVIMPTMPIPGLSAMPTPRKASHGWDTPGGEEEPEEEVLERQPQVIPFTRHGGPQSWDDPSGADDTSFAMPSTEPVPMPKRGGWDGSHMSGGGDWAPRGNREEFEGRPMPVLPGMEEYHAMQMAGGKGGKFGYDEGGKGGKFGYDEGGKGGAFGYDEGGKGGAFGYDEGGKGGYVEEEPEEDPVEKAKKRAKFFAIPKALAAKRNNVQSSLASLAASLLGNEAAGMLGEEEAADGSGDAPNPGQQAAGAGMSLPGGKGGPFGVDPFGFEQQAAASYPGASSYPGGSSDFSGFPGSSQPAASSDAAPEEEKDEGLTPAQQKVLENLRHQQAERERQEAEERGKKVMAEQEAAVAAATTYQHYWIRQQMNSLMELYKHAS